MQSNSDSDNNDVSGLDDSNDKLSDGSNFIDDFDKKPIESIHTSIHISPISSEQIKVGNEYIDFLILCQKDNNKTKEAMQAIKSNVMSLSSTSSCSSETIAEDEVRTLLLRKQHMIFTELIQYFLPKAENLSSEEIKNGIVQKLSKILQHLNIEEKTINGEKHIQVKLFN